MPRLRSILIALLVILLVGTFTLWRLLQADFFWRWAGGHLVSAAQESINGSLTVKEIKGNPINGLIFQGVTVSSPDGEVLRLKSLEIRLSLWSVVRLKPVIGKLAFIEPHLNLVQDKDGQWNVNRLVRASEKPSEGGLSLPLRSISFRQILMVDGEVNLIQPGKATRYHNLDVDLAVTLDKPLKPEQTLKVSKALAAVTTPKGRFALNTRLTFGRNRLNLANLSVEGDQERFLSLTGKANLAKEPGDIRFQGELGPVKGKTISRFWAKWPGNWDVDGTIQAKGTLGHVELDIKGKIHQAPYAITGVLEQKAGKWQYNAALDLEGLKPEILTAFDTSWVEKSKELSPISLHLRAKGVGLGWPLKRFVYTLESEPFTYGAARFEQFKVTAEGDEQKQKLEASLQGNFGQASLASKGSFFKAPAGEVVFQAKSLQPDLLGTGAPEGSVLDARFVGSFSLPDFQKVDSLKVTGKVEASGRVGEQPLKELKGEVAWQKPNLRIPQFRIILGNVLAELKGVLEGERLDFSFQGKSIPGGNWPVPAAVGGQLTWEGALAGRLTDPTFSFKANGRRLSYAEYSIQSFALTARGAGWPLRSGLVDFQGAQVKTPAGVFTQATFRGETENERWKFRFNAASPKGPQVEFAGNANFADRPLEATLDLFRFQIKNVSGQNQGPVRLRFLPGLELAPATLVINEGTATMEARIQGTEVAGRLEAQDIPAELLGEADLRGKIQARVSLEGSADRPIIQGEVRLEPAQWRSLAITSAKATLNYRETSLNLSGSLAERSGAQVQWEGRLPLVLSFSPFQFVLPEEDLSFRLRGEGINLSMLTAFTGEVEEAEAPITLLADLQGRLSKPRVFGQVKWGSGFVIARQTGARYRLQPGVITLKDDKLIIPQLTLMSDGTATLSADVRLAGLKPQEVRARAQFADFKALDRLRSEAFLNGNVSIDGPWTALAVVGGLTIPRATLNPQLFKIGEGTEINKDIILVHQKKTAEKKESAKPATEPDFMRDMRIAVTVDAPNDVWVRDKQADVEVSLNISIHKRPGEPIVVGGMIRSLQGKVDVQGRSFNVVKGIVDLPERPGQEPYIEARAVHEMWDVTIIVDVTGTPKRPHLELSSEPDLPKSEILSYLVFGRPSSALSQEEFSASNMAAGALGGFTAQKIQEILGPDFPLLGDVAVKSGQGTLGIVKPLAKGVTLSFGRETSPLGKEEGFQGKLQYRVNRNVTIEAQTGANPGGDIFFNYDF